MGGELASRQPRAVRQEVESSHQCWYILQSISLQTISRLRPGTEYVSEYQLRGADGVYRWFVARAAPVKNHSGVIIRWFGTCTDVDENKKEEAAAVLRSQIEASEKKYRLLAEAIPIMVWSANGEGITDYGNQRWVEYMGPTENFTWGPDSVYLEDWMLINGKWQSALREHTSFEAEYRIKRFFAVLLYYSLVTIFKVSGRRLSVASSTRSAFT